MVTTVNYHNNFFLLFKKYDVVYFQLQTRNITKLVEETFTSTQMRVESIHVLAHG